MGDFAFPCFAVAKQLRNAPGKISSELAQKLATGDIITDIKAHGPYLNFYVSKKMIFKIVLDEVFTDSDSYGSSDSGVGKTAVIDYSSPNIAKHLAVIISVLQ
jgi:arginyl-tRNA synthetase